MRKRDMDAYMENQGEMEEIWAMFTDESMEHLEKIEECLLTIENDPCNEDKIDELFIC